jgi:hypothetical protein
MAPFWWENQSVEPQKTKKKLKRELMILRTKMQAKVQGKV